MSAGNAGLTETLGSIDLPLLIWGIGGNSPDICGGSKVEAFTRILVADRWDEKRWPVDDRVSYLFNLHESGY